jgi:hypothetical protein
VRLDDGSLAAIPASELHAQRPAIVASLQRREPLALRIERNGARAIAYLSREPVDAPSTARPFDLAFEVQMNRYLKSTEEWAPPDRPAPAERHFIRKKRRAAFFEARHKGS